jgi:hemerythrin-like domain-containing protein
MGETDVYSAIQCDHQRLRRLFEQLLETPDHAFPARQQFCAQIAQALKVHTEAENDTFYAALEPYQAARDLVADAHEDHQRLLQLLGEIDSLTADDEEWQELVMELRAEIESHIDAEEIDLFPLARELLGDKEAQALGQRFQQVNNQAKP